MLAAVTPSPPPDPATVPAAVRGIERPGRHAGDGLRAVANGLLFVPRSALDLFLAGSEVGVRYALRTESGGLLDFLRFGNSGFLPLAAWSSESFPALGAAFYHHGDKFEVAADAVASNDDFWRLRFEASGRPADATALEITTGIAVEFDDDREFHGIGAVPRDDPRSAFRQRRGPDAGRYVQRLETYQLAADLQVTPRTHVRGMTQYRRRRVLSEGTEERFDAIFDVSRLAGADRRGEQVYTELDGRWDTRPFPDVLAPGLRVEAYAGVSVGVGDDRSRFVRGGADVAALLPVLLRNRLVILRATVDAVGNLRDSVPLAFADYPRHPTFRGVSSRRTILRTDSWVLVPSLAYAWPLTHGLNAHVFTDRLLVGSELANLTLRDAPWSAGFILEVHTRHHSLARWILAGGSEGMRVSVTFGGALRESSRKEWK